MTVSNRIFAFWTGDNPMSDNRKRGLDSFALTGLEPVLVTRADLPHWIVEGAPLHPAFDLLHATHQSDYLRAYFMHHHGGGYADIKSQQSSWLDAVERVNVSRWLWGAGYPEVPGGTVAIDRQTVNGQTFLLATPVSRQTATVVTLGLRGLRPLLIGNGCFYFKRDTTLTRRWLAAVEHRLDFVHDVLAANPPSGPQDKAEDGMGYPIPWSWLMGAILGPLATRYMARLDRSLPRPGFRDYR